MRLVRLRSYFFLNICASIFWQIRGLYFKFFVAKLKYHFPDNSVLCHGFSNVNQTEKINTENRRRKKKSQTVYLSVN